MGQVSDGGEQDAAGELRKGPEGRGWGTGVQAFSGGPLSPPLSSKQLRSQLIAIKWPLHGGHCVGTEDRAVERKAPVLHKLTYQRVVRHQGSHRHSMPGPHGR